MTTAQRYVDVYDLALYAGVGRSSAIKLGKDAKAVIKIGRCTRYDLVKIEEYLNGNVEA